MWFNKIKTDLAYLPDMVDYFENELIAAHKETKISGSLEKNSQELPAQVSWRFMQLQEIEAVLKHLNILYDKKRSEHYRRYLERYNRELSDRSIEKYIDGEQDVVDLAQLINEVALVRNKYLAITKGLDSKGFQLGHVIRLRVAGMDDAVL
mgnify:CR=1 FL=1